MTSVILKFFEQLSKSEGGEGRNNARRKRKSGKKRN
jgi:hypothetical protein